MYYWRETDRFLMNDAHLWFAPMMRKRWWIFFSLSPLCTSPYRRLRSIKSRCELPLDLSKTIPSRFYFLFRPIHLIHHGFFVPFFSSSFTFCCKRPTAIKRERDLPVVVVIVSFHQLKRAARFDGYNLISRSKSFCSGTVSTIQTATIKSFFFLSFFAFAVLLFFFFFNVVVVVIIVVVVWTERKAIELKTVGPAHSKI